MVPHAVRLSAAIAAIIAGEKEVFFFFSWTVNGETITTTVGVEGYNDQEYILTDEAGNTYFAESSLGSAPAFAFRIDGITELNTVF